MDGESRGARIYWVLLRALPAPFKDGLETTNPRGREVFIKS
jgi:hypothetical protein